MQLLYSENRKQTPPLVSDYNRAVCHRQRAFRAVQSTVLAFSLDVCQWLFCLQRLTSTQFLGPVLLILVSDQFLPSLKSLSK